MQALKKVFGPKTPPGTVSAPASPTGEPATPANAKTKLNQTEPARLNPAGTAPGQASGQVGKSNTPTPASPSTSPSTPLASPTSSNTGYVPTYEDVKTYLEDIQKLAADYNENPIPLWILDPLSKHLRKIASMHNHYPWSADNSLLPTGGVYMRIAEPLKNGPSKDGGIDHSDFKHIADLLNDIHAKTDWGTQNCGFDKAVLTTWWVLKRRGLTASHDTGDTFTPEFIQTLSEDSAFIKGYHDAWAMSALYDLLPDYSGEEPKLKAVSIGANKIVADGVAALVATITTDAAMKSLADMSVVSSEESIGPIVSDQKNKGKKSMLLFKLGGKNAVYMRTLDLWQLIEAKNLATNVAMMDVVIGASFLRLLNKMETDTYGDLTRDIPDIKTLIPVEPASGGAKKKKRKPVSAGKKKAVKSKNKTTAT